MSVTGTNNKGQKRVNGISICICTYRRPHLLEKLLQHLLITISKVKEPLEIIIVDNDSSQSAKELIERYQPFSPVEIIYISEPEKNISIARNRAVKSARYDLVALIDDDEFPSPNWLVAFIEFYRINSCDGLLGPVEPFFEINPPSWMIEANFFKRKRYKSGTILQPANMRTGNAFLKKSLFNKHLFNPVLGHTGGEDVDIFERMNRDGYRFLWCDEAVVFEFIPKERISLNFQIKKAMFRGLAQSIINPYDFKSLIKSMIAVSIYFFCLPFIGIFKLSHFNLTLIKLFDHFGKILGYLHIFPLKTRPGWE